MATLVAEAREVNDGLRAYSFINMADAQGADNAAAVAGIEPPELMIVRRKAFPNAFSEGLSVVEQLPGDQKAVDELLSIIGAMYTQKVDNGHQDATHRKAS